MGGRAADPRVEFLKVLARELAPLGQTAAELTEQLAGCSDGLGLSAHFFVLPTVVQIIYEEFGEERIAFVPVGRGTVDLETHALLESVAVSVGKGWISPQAGRGTSRLWPPSDRTFPCGFVWRPADWVPLLLPSCWAAACVRLLPRRPSDWPWPSFTVWRDAAAASRGS